LKKKEKHEGSFDIIHLKDAAGNKFSTRSGNVFIIGKNANSPLVSLPKGKGIKLTIIQDRDRKKLNREKQASAS
jgi:small subunit ribosomal protein S4e